MPYSGVLETQGHDANIQITALKKILENEKLGAWSLDSQTITLLWGILCVEQPRCIMECGSGLSTLILAQYADFSSVIFLKPCRVISFEQNIQMKQVVEDKLANHGLKKHACIIHSPISAQGNYEFDSDQILQNLGNEKVDWILIDGPSTLNGHRAETLPYLAKFCCSGAKWFLDDAFRDEELYIVNQWSYLSGITVDGIYPIGKGLATGQVSCFSSDK